MGIEFIKTEKVRFQHTDPAGIVFYPRFLEMLNCLVEDWFEEALNLPFKTLHQTTGVPTVDLQVQFKKAARLGDLLTKKLWVKKIGNSSVVYGFCFMNNNETCVQGEATLVFVKYTDNKISIFSQPWTPELKTSMSLYLVDK
jgi:4-hydroxybenzoyl-CoA thioesterase